MTTPETKKVRAIDVVPYRWGLWCTVGDSKPFVNDIEGVSWSDDGQHIWFMLGTHNFYKAEPNEIVELVPCEPVTMSEAFMKEEEERHKKFVQSRPQPTQKCLHCKGVGHVRYWPGP
jgi:hypothetical protein